MALPRRPWDDRPQQQSLHLLLLRYQGEIGMSVSRATRRKLISERHPNELKPATSTGVASPEWFIARLEPALSSPVCRSRSRRPTLLEIEKRRCFLSPLPPAATVSWSSLTSPPSNLVRLQAAS